MADPVINTSSDSTPQASPPKQPTFLKLLEAGFFEIIFVIISISIIFGALNYFNVFDLSKTYAPLAILPKLHALPTPSPMPTGFSYDTNLITTQLSQFVSSVLQDTYSHTINISSPQKLLQSDNTFSYVWNLDRTVNAVGKEINKPLSNDSDYFQLAVTSATVSANLKEATASAATIVNNFFKPFAGKTPLNCTNENNLLVCEQFDTTIYGDVGQGVVWKSNNTLMIFSCSIPINSSRRFVKKTCLPLQ